jgi:hypothetical protein
MLQLRVKASSTLRPRERRSSRKSQVRLDSHQANDLAMAYRAGESAKVLAEQFGIHRTTVTAVLLRLGVDLRRSGLAAVDIPAAATLYCQGWSCARLGANFGVDAATIWRTLRTAGVVMRVAKPREPT